MVQIFANGLGGTNPPAPDDRRVGSYDYVLSSPVKMLFNGVAAEIVSATRSPYAPPGVTELRVRVPEGVTGRVPLSFGNVQPERLHDFPNHLHIYVQ
ncbi:MAG: hypothetical protein U5J83_08125 [Bryobacterales bacterium]|nr:hypothetical protein [Bryobacterales bacterium]